MRINLRVEHRQFHLLQLNLIHILRFNLLLQFILHGVEVHGDSPDFIFAFHFNPDGIIATFNMVNGFIKIKNRIGNTPAEQQR
ncbi:hypothetical protein D3C85_1207060 [compost metagenome]